MVAETELFESTELTALNFCLQGWMKNEVHKRKVDKRDEPLARNLDAAACMKKSADQLRRIMRDRRTRAAKCTEADSGIYEHLL